MNDKAVAKELVAVARELTAAAPKMKKTWNDIPIGHKFKDGRAVMLKLDKNTAVESKLVKRYTDKGVGGPRYEAK